MNKVLWIDVETTGLDKDKHGLIQLAYIYEEDGEIKETDSIVARLFEDDIVDLRALEINGVNPIILNQYPSPHKSFNKFLSFLNKKVSVEDYKDKVTIVGYNTQFDIGFLRKWFEKNNNNVFDKYFNRKYIDIMQMAIYLNYIKKINTINNKLITLCDYFNIELNPHDAMNDIKATYELSEKIKELVK